MVNTNSLLFTTIHSKLIKKTGQQPRPKNTFYVIQPQLLAKIQKKLIKTYQKVKLLILDEWILKPLSTYQAFDLFAIIEVLTRQGAMIFCTPLDQKGWYSRIGSFKGAFSEAIIDCIKHNAYEIIIDEKESMRERHGINHNKGLSAI